MIGQEEKEMAYRVAIITLSDSGYKGEREDVSGGVIAEIVEKFRHISLFRS